MDQDSTAKFGGAGLISAAELMALQGAGVPIAIADCRFSLADPAAGRRAYGAGHIPGAVYFDLERDLSDPVDSFGGRHPLPDRDRLAQLLGDRGIGSGHDGDPPTLVVIYDDARFAIAARLWWLLKIYCGHAHVALLDGGWQGWQTAGGAISTEIPTPTPRSFVPPAPIPKILTWGAIRDRLPDPNFTLVDARSPDRYRGEVEPIDPVAGHIPGAINYFWQAATDDRGYAKSPEALRHWFASGPQDLTQKTAIAVYCGSGVTACVNLWALERAGICGAQLYGGSWSDWCTRRPPLPVATGPNP
jgi:thiosulfate/3-mercaptopyruvate sulfurtransferase